MSEEDIRSLVELGFARPLAEQALKRFNNKVEDAANFLFTNMTSEIGHVEDTGLATAVQESMSNELRPATRGEYPTESWSVVPFKNPLLTEQREEDMVPLLIGNTVLGPLLTILHQIPLARKALLGTPQHLYTDNWYTNHESLPNEANVQLQRLMLFLDGQNARAAAEIYQLESLVPEPHMESLAKHTQSDIFKSQGKNLQEEQEFWFSELACDATVAVNETIWSMVDDMVWEEGTDAMISHVGDIVTLKIKRDDGVSGGGVLLPETWYPHRYSEDSYRYIKQIRGMKKQLSQQRVKNNNDKYVKSSFNQANVKSFLNASASYLEGVNPDAAKELVGIQSQHEQTLAQMDAFASDCHSKLSNIDNLLREPNQELFEEFFPGEVEPKMEPYKLVGVAISPQEVLYKAPSLVDVDEWVHVVNRNVRYKQEVSFETAQHLAYEGSSEHQGQPVVAIYASQDALSAQNVHSIEFLRFVEMDNKQMQESSDEEGPQQLPQDPNDDYMAGEVIDL